MRVPWKLIGVAGLAGVAATGAVAVRRRQRAQQHYEPDELRARLHARLAEASSPGATASSAAPPPPSPR